MTSTTEGGQRERAGKWRWPRWTFFIILKCWIYICLSCQSIYTHTHMYSAFFTHTSGHMISPTDRRERPNAKWIIRMHETFTYNGLSGRFSVLSLQLLNVPHVAVASYLCVCCVSLCCVALRWLHLYLNVFKRPTIWVRPRRALSVAGPCTLIHCLARTRNFFASLPAQRGKRGEREAQGSDRQTHLFVRIWLWLPALR